MTIKLPKGFGEVTQVCVCVCVLLVTQAQKGSSNHWNTQEHPTRRWKHQIFIDFMRLSWRKRNDVPHKQTRKRKAELS